MKAGKILSTLTPTSIMWIVLGAGIMLFSAYVGKFWRMYAFAVGLFLLGVGGILCGLTNGFTDHSPNGRIIGKFGLLALGGGLLLCGYYMFRMIR